MADKFPGVFAALKPVFSKHEKRLSVKTDKPREYTLETKSPSPFPQHKGHPLYFCSLRQGKAYVSFHLMPLYMQRTSISAALKKRMQGKTCFNFKSIPEPELIAELERLTEAGLKSWEAKKWL